MDQKNKTYRRGAYIYGPKTAAGFARMQRLGIPKPPFALEQKITRHLAGIYKAEVDKYISEFLEEVKAGMPVQDADGIDETESEEIKRAAVQRAVGILAGRWAMEAAGFAYDPEAVESWFLKVLKADTEHFFKLFLPDASEKLKQGLFGLDSRLIFTKDIEAVMQDQIREAKKKVSLACLDLKWAFLSKLSDYASGKTDAADVKGIVDYIGDMPMKYGRFFARDQMSRFNKALTVATFKRAGVTKVRWCTCRDSRVRPTHAALEGEVFPINALPPEKDDYNCRCGLVPAGYEGE